jgi:hypothetical protein
VKPGIEIQKKELSMNKSISLVVLAIGIVILILGINAYDSTSSDISRFFTGSPTDKSVWMLAGGFLGILIGMTGLLRMSKRS